MSESVERIKLLEEQKKELHLRLRPDTLKLCEILQFSDAAKNFVELLLEYVINNHLIDRKSIMLQAFQISLCWTAASLLKQKINHKESLANAKKNLNFNCNKDQVDYVYAMLQCLKSRLLCYKDHSNENVPHFSQKVTSEIGGSSAQKDVTKSIKEIQKKFQKKMENFNIKQQKEITEVLESYKEEKENLEFKHKIESVVIGTCFWRYVLLSGKCEWEIEQEKEVEDHKHQMEKHLENLRKLQLEAASNLKEKENIWVMQLKRWACDELLYGPSLDAPKSEEQNPITIVATVQEKVPEPGVLDKESNDHANSGEEQRNLVYVNSSSFEDQILVSTSGKENHEARLLAPNIATQVNQQNIIEFAVNQNSYQEMALGSSPLADQDQGTDMLATSSAAQDSVNQNTCQPMEDSDFNQVSQVAMQFNGFDLPLSNTRPPSVTFDIPPPHNCELLQHELERLEREREGNLKSHEDKKLRLKSDMEKGIEELKAQICQEYETKLQQIEAEFILKKEDLLAIHKKISIQMLLAHAWDWAFKSNVTDVVGSSSSGVHHDGNFTVDRQLVLSYMQQNAERPSLVSNLSPDNPPAAYRQTTPLARVFSPHYGSPLIQSVDVLPTTILSSTNPASQSHISSFSFSTGRPQGRVEISLPLQHQPCRPSIPFTGGTSAFSHEEGSSNNQPQRNSLSSYLRELILTQPRMPVHDREIAWEPSSSVTGTSPVYQQIGVMSNQQPHRSSPPSLPHDQRTLVPTQQLVPDNIVNHSESAIGFPALRSASALELLMDTGSWHSTQNGSRLEPSSGSTVCLSDED